MTNNQLLKKLSEDMKMRNFSHYTYDAYMGKTREMIRYFNKPMEKVTMEELRYFLYQHLLIERKLADRSINYYNSIIRFVYEVTLDKVLNKKQLPMRKRKRAVYKVLTREELGSFFNCVDDFKFKTIFMLAYGAGLRIGEIANLRVEDIDSKTMRIFVREGKGNKERYTILPEETLKMLRIYWSKYIQNRRRGRIFLSETGAIGAHKYVCDECGYEEIAYNSCRNRHCPNCQAGKKLQWIEARKEEVLNIKYYHVVFTIPDELNLITLQNQSKIYNILFKTSAETLQELAEDKKYLGGELGFFSILHTWGQNMMYHPHVHIVTTGGGLTELNKWVEKEEDFFIPVKVMSKVFRGKFLYYLKQEKLEFYGKNEHLENPASYNSLIQELYNKDWIVYCKEPFNNTDCVIQYLGRYTHRVAISNERILNVTDETVTFKWRDYKDNNQMKEMTVTIEEFIRRFLLHILPPHFMKIRYYGILGNRNKKKKLLKCKILTRTKIYQKEKLPTLELLKKTLGKDFNLCPHCKKGHMLIPNTT